MIEFLPVLVLVLTFLSLLIIGVPVNNTILHLSDSIKCSYNFIEIESGL